MISYAKGAAPARLTELAATPSGTWDGLGTADRDPIRAALIRDQSGLCAYCQRRIDAATDPATGAARMKIEHWVSRSESSEHHFTWAHLLGVCLGTSDAPSGTLAQHCDASRRNRRLFLHPVQGQGADPREHLRYTKGGEVTPVANDPRVKADIDALQLNAWRLVRGRAAVFDAAWARLKRKGFATGELHRLEQSLRIAPGVQVPEHAEFLRHHVREKLRRLGAPA